MKRRYIAYTLAALVGIIFTGCSNLFENIINDDLSFKKGDDSLLINNNNDISSGLVVIKSSEKNRNQISFMPEQKIYFVGEVPEDYSDFKIDYKNGSKVTLTGKDGPVELRCFVNDLNAKVQWTLTQTWEYIPEYEEKSVTDDNGKQIVYKSIKTQHAEKLEKPVLVSYDLQKQNAASIITADLPYGVVVATCKVIADDAQYKSEYKIILTKKYVDRKLMVFGAQDKTLNKISFNSLQELYEIEDITELDNDMTFQCYLADSDKKVEWKAKKVIDFDYQISTYSKEIVDPLLGTKEKVDYKYISGQKETACDEIVECRPSDSEDFDANEILITVPIGITEVTAIINSDDSGEEAKVYTIRLRNNLINETVSEKEFEESLKKGEAIGDYSQLEDLEITIVDDKNNDESSAKLEPEFSPATTIYTLTVDEDADEINIEALAESENTEISDPKVITKYGEVLAVDGMNVSLVGGTSRITFTVTDETNISRTYTIYVEKPEDGDTTLESLEISPDLSFANGLALDRALNKAYKGGSENSDAYYNMTLSADSRKDVREVNFRAKPTNKRTIVSYGISDSDKNLPSVWSTPYDKTSVKDEKVIVGDEDTSTIEKVLWIKTVSDEYYHIKQAGYESEKRADTTYHKILLSKAGDANKEITALAIDVTYEDGSTKTIDSQISSAKVAFQVKDLVKDIDTITTFADKLEIYFRPLDKDSLLSYSVINIEDGTERNITSEAKLEKINGNCEKFKDDSTEYYKLTIGSIEEGVDSTKDLPRGVTTVKLGDRTFTFKKPDLKNVSYKVGLGNGELKWDNYIYLKYEETSVNMLLTSQQQNQILDVESYEHILGPNDKALGEGEKSSDVRAEIIRQEGSLTAWTNIVDNIPVGTTRVTIKVTNGKEGEPVSATRDFYIVRADTTETRLKTLMFDGKTPDAFKTDWKEGMTNSSYTYNISKPVNVEAGKKVLTFAPLYSNAYITLEKYQSANGNLSDADDESWILCSKEGKAGINLSTFEENFTLENSNENAGTSIKYTIKVSTLESEEPTHIYNIIIHIEADKIAQLDALKIIQKGENEDMSRTILANSFDPEILEYKDLSASLNYKGDIVITPYKYAKANIVRRVLKCDDREILADSDTGIEFADDGSITIPYSVYSEKLGKIYSVSYEVQAQDTSIERKTYTVEFEIPEYTIITETSKTSVSKDLSYEVPEGVTGGLGFRFGSVISDETLLVKDYFGGIDIVGSSDGETWYESSFGGSGLQIVLKIDGSNYWVKLNGEGRLAALYSYEGNKAPEAVATPEGIDFAVEPRFVVENESQYLELKFLVTNRNGKSVKLGAAIDTLIGTIEEASLASNDSVNVEATNNGFTMKGKDYSFSILLKNAYEIDDVSDFWYGPYDSGKFLQKIFDENKISDLSENEDSAASFYWDIGEEKESSKKIRIFMESVK